MALNLDVSKLTQSAAMKPTAHDNCIVLDLGTGAYPRDIEVRLPDDDGARQNALWDGSLNLAVNDEVLCFEYSGISAWRVMAMGGNDGGAGKARVSEVWDSVFGDVALQSDADGDIGIGTATIPHGGVGWAKLALDGADFAEGGPHIQLTTDVDDYPVMQIFGGTHEEQGIFFDSYYDGSSKSSFSGGNFQILNKSGRLRFRYATGVAAGSVISWSEGIALRDNGRTGFGTISPSAQIDSNSSSIAQLRLSHTLLTKFADLTVDTNHDLTIDPSSTGQIKLDATVTVIDEIQREGDADTKIGLADDKISLTAGGLLMFEAVEIAGQDTLDLGDVAGGGDVDIDFNDGQLTLQGSNALLTASGDMLFTKGGGGSIGPAIYLESTSSGAVDSEFLFFAAGQGSVSTTEGPVFGLRGNTFSRSANQRGFAFLSAGDVSSPVGLDGSLQLTAYSFHRFTIAASTLMHIDSTGVGLNGVTVPSTALDLGAGAIEGEEMTDPGAGAANTYRLFAEDNGAGKTRLMVRFATGAAQQIEIQP